MKTINRITLFVMTGSNLGSILFAQDYRNTIVSTDFDIITAKAPSCFTGLDYKGIKSAEMPDKTAVIL